MSWADEQARSRSHMQSMLVMTLDEAKRRLERFEKEFPDVAKFWHDHPALLLTSHDDVEVTIRTGDREARCRAANPVDAGSNPVLCSKIKPEDVDPVNGDYGPWLRSGKK